ncbi:MAG: Aerobic respiration control sensor protein ArcB [Bacteroidota bacterium]|jgi:signal transduction histidine kinase/CheY-like chemotaxis protein
MINFRFSTILLVFVIILICSCEFSKNKGIDESILNQKIKRVKSILYSQNDYTAALNAIDSIVYSTNYIPESEVKADAYLVMAQIYLAQNKLSSAMKSVVAAENIYSKKNNRQGITECNFQTGVITYQERNYELASKYFEISLKSFDSLENKKKYFQTLYLLGLCNLELKKYPESFNQFLDAKNYYKKAINENGIAECNSGFAKLYFENGNYYSSLKCFDSVLNYSILFKNVSGGIIAKIGKGKNYLRMHKSDTAKALLENALQESIDNKFFDGVVESSYFLKELYSLKEDYKLSSFYQEKYYSFRDSIYNHQTARNINDLQNQVEIERKKIEIDTLQDSKRVYQIWMLVLGIVILFGSLVIYLFYKSSKTKQRLNEKLTTSNEELKQSQEQILKLQKYKESFLANITHELRTPLNAIKGISDLLSFSNNEEEKKELVSGLKKSSNHLLNMVNDFLDFSKLKEGKLILRRQPFQLQSVIKSAVNFLKINAEEKQLAYTLELNQMPETVMGDESRLIQILVNIIGNSIKFTSTGFVKVVCKGKLLNENKCEIEIKISDSGIGISIEKIKSIFEDYEQADENIAATFGGTGLGLGICKRLIEQHQGTITCESELGKGSTFIIKLPYEYLKIEEIEIKNLQNFDSLTTQKINIIIADDNEMNLLVAEKLIEKNMPFAKLLKAENGKQVIDLINKNKVDLILMDMKMPVMDGIEATKIIRADKSIIQPYIIAMTAGTSEDEIAACYESGMNDYLPKPYHIEILLSKIQKVAELIASN